ncbi:MAG: PH domain-containing protein [Novosphingobium sp.]
MELNSPIDMPILSSGERMIWQGKPKPGIWLEPADAFAIPFSIFWLGMVTLIFGLALSGNAGKVDPMAFVVLPVFVVAGLYLAIGRFIVAKFVRQSTNYVLTDRRAIIRSGLFRRSERSVSLVAVSEIRLSAIRNGFGTIEFGQSNPFYRMMPRSWSGQFSSLCPAFEKIPDAEKIYRLAIDTQASQGMAKG